MNKIILIEDDKDIHSLLKLNLETYTGAEIIPRDTAKDAIDFLSILPSIRLIISRDRIGDENSAKTLLNYIREQEESIVDLIIFGENVPDYKEGEIVSITDRKLWKDVVESAKTILKIDTKKLEKDAMQEFVPIPLSYFYSIESTPCDVFIRIKKSPSNIQFVKRIHFGDTFDKDTIKRYEAHGLKNFYIPKSMELNYTNFISNALVTKLNNPELTEPEQFKVMEESYDMATKKILELGFSSATVQLAESVIAGMVHTVEKIPRMNNFLLQIVNNSSGFIYQHAHMTCAVASSCIQETEFSKDKDIFSKISFASFFQNVLLSEDSNLAKISSEEELKKFRLDKDSQEKVLRHPLDAFNLVQQYGDVPRGADLLIKHHHGSLDGIGFSINIGRLPELSRIFVVASDFVHQFFSIKEKGVKSPPIIKVIEQKYASGGKLTTEALEVLNKALQKRT